jgi:hypothetical protein
MLFLYRPRQTWIPYRVPRQPTQQAAYNRELQEKFGATRRVQAPVPAPGDPAAAASQNVVPRLREIARLHADGALSDEEFAAAKAKVLEAEPGGP